MQTIFGKYFFTLKDNLFNSHDMTIFGFKELITSLKYIVLIDLLLLIILKYIFFINEIIR